MTNFETTATVSFEADTSGIDDVRSEFEDKFGDVPITAADTGGSGLMADGGSPLSGLGEGLDSLVSLAEDRNTILAELRETLDAQALESAQGGGDGVDILPLVGGGGGLASFFGGLGKALPGIGGGANIGFPALGPEFAQRVEDLREALGQDSLIPDDLVDAVGGEISGQFDVNGSIELDASDLRKLDRRLLPAFQFLSGDWIRFRDAV